MCWANAKSMSTPIFAIAQWQYWLATMIVMAEKYGWPVRATWLTSGQPRILERGEKALRVVHVTSVARKLQRRANDTFTNVSAQKA